MKLYIQLKADKLGLAVPMDGHAQPVRLPKDAQLEGGSVAVYVEDNPAAFSGPIVEGKLSSAADAPVYSFPAKSLKMSPAAEPIREEGSPSQIAAQLDPQAMAKILAAMGIDVAALQMASAQAAKAAPAPAPAPAPATSAPAAA